MRRPLFLAAVFLLATATLAGAASAQVLTGIVLQGDSVTPARGVLVEVRANSLGEPVRALTSARGAFRITLASADTVRARVLRPGFRPTVAPPVFVATGATRELRIVLGNQPVTLAAVTVREARVCGERADAAAWQLWEQARTVLHATALTERDTSLIVRTLEFQGPATPRGETTVWDSTIAFVPVDPEFPRAHYDSLFRYGFIRQNGDRITTYYAPNARVLLDERFVMTHCFRVAESSASPPGLVGVRFEPVRPGRTVDIEGTFWLDAKRFLLRQIDFGYANPPRGHRVAGTGGFVTFAELGTGHWVMSEWSVRMSTLMDYKWKRGAHGLWSRNQLIVTVLRGDELLYHQPAGDSLATRIVPRHPRLLDFAGRPPQ